MFRATRALVGRPRSLGRIGSLRFLAGCTNFLLSVLPVYSRRGLLDQRQEVLPVQDLKCDILVGLNQFHFSIKFFGLRSDDLAIERGELRDRAAIAVCSLYNNPMGWTAAIVGTVTPTRPAPLAPD